MRRGSAVLSTLGAALFAALCTGTAAEPDPRRSGFDFMSPATQALQKDDAANPAMLWVAEGEAAWTTPAGAAGRACADCHGAAATGMAGVAARHPAILEATGRPVDLAGRIEHCRRERQNATPLPPESRELIALAAYLGLQSRGMPITAGTDPRLEPFRAEGEALYRRRIGQLNLACANCHDEQAGRRLGASPIPEAHPTGYPIYRLEWQDMGSLQRRLRNCMTGVRAEPYPYGAPEYVALELFLMTRARGMTMETPAVRP